MSVLRYPGGKHTGKVSSTVISMLGRRVCVPFAGGLGVALRCSAKLVIINDKDPLVADLWNQVIQRPERLCERILETDDSLSSWESASQLRDGFDLLVRGRLSYGGYINGKYAKPQGRRWNPEYLVKEVWKAHRRLRGLKCHCTDYWRFLDHQGLYLDPPYWQDNLYRYGIDHLKLRDQLAKRSEWILTYNDCPEVRAAYDGCKFIETTTNGNRGKSKEVIIIP